MSTLIRVMLDVSRLTAADFLARVNAVFAGMNGNPAYPNPPIPMPVFRTAIDEYFAAITAALDGGARAIGQRNTLGEALRRMLRQLANYVEANCKDDMTMFLSSGFLAVSSTRTKTNPLTESIRYIENGISGEFIVTLVKVPDAVSYELRWAPVASGGSPGDWTNLPIAAIRPATSVTGLIPGTTYVFEARALTRSGLTEWSDSITRICT